MKKLMLVIICALSASCAASSVKESKKPPSSAAEFTVEENYQRVYSNLLDNIHECKGKVWPGESASYRIRNKLSDEAKEGRITFIMYNAGSQRYYIHMVIAQTLDNQTKAKAYIYNHVQKDYIPLIKQWAFEADSDCELSELVELDDT